MKVDETKHAYIDLETKEINALCDISTFLERLTDTVIRLENENIAWDIRSDMDEDDIFSTMEDIRRFINRLI